LYSSILSEANIILIDEPESYLHPSWQRALLKYFQKISDKQYIIASHSNVFLDSNYVNRVFQTKYSTKIEIADIQEKTLALHDLGYLTIDNLQGDLLILVEGKTDTAVLEELLNTLGYRADYDIKIMSCGGVSNIDSMPLEMLKMDYNTVMVLLDGDWTLYESLEKPKERIEEKCNTLGIYFKALDGYGIENYFPLSVFDNSIDASKLNTSKTKLKLDVKVTKNKDDAIFRKHAKKMTKEEIEDTGDLYDFLKDIMKVCDDSLPEK
jgi:predicted ATP-dependent endonuclease of OLD family